MKKTSQLINLPILSISEGVECGKVRDLLIDAANGTAVALILETTEVDWFYGAKLLPYQAIVGLGESALVINESADILPIAERSDFGALLKANVKVIGTKVLTKSGEIKGKVIEFSIDSTGKIQVCEMEKPDGTIINIPAKDVVTFGKEVLFVTQLDDEGSAASPAAVAIESEKKTDLTQQPPAIEPAATEENTANIANKIVPTPTPEVETNAVVPPVADVVIPEEKQPVAAELPPVEPVAPKEKVIAEAAADKVIPTPEPTPPAPPPTPAPTPTPITTPASVPTPEVKPTVPLSTQAAVTSEADDAVKNLDDKRRELLIGKKVSKRIETENGVLIVDKNGVVTEEVLQKATLTNKLKELYINILK